MTTRKLTECIEEIVVHQRLEETQPSQMRIPGYSDWNPWGASLKFKFLEELERRGRDPSCSASGLADTRRISNWAGAEVKMQCIERFVGARRAGSFSAGAAHGQAYSERFGAMPMPK
jgi:hypothetical protein